MFRLLPNQIAPLAGTMSPMAWVTELTILHTVQLMGQPPLNCTLTNLHSVFTSIVFFSHTIQVKMERPQPLVLTSQGMNATTGAPMGHDQINGPTHGWAYPAGLPLGPGGPGNPMPGWPTAPFSPGRPGLPGVPGKPRSPVVSKTSGQ